MEYQIDITNSYQRFLCLDNNIGINSYLSFDLSGINSNEFNINLENIEVNMSEGIWYSPIINKNSESIVSMALNKIDLNDCSSILTLLLRRSKLVINDMKCMYLKLANDIHETYHTLDSNFSVGDKYIWLAGQSADYANVKVNLKIIFSGKVKLIFEESDILIQTIEFDDFINNQNVEDINRYQDLIVNLKNKKFSEASMNNIPSKFLDFDFSKHYFRSNEDGNFAIKDYKYDY